MSLPHACRGVPPVSAAVAALQMQVVCGVRTTQHTAGSPRCLQACHTLPKASPPRPPRRGVRGRLLALRTAPHCRLQGCRAQPPDPPPTSSRTLCAQHRNRCNHGCAQQARQARMNTFQIPPPPLVTAAPPPPPPCRRTHAPAHHSFTTLPPLALLTAVPQRARHTTNQPTSRPPDHWHFRSALGVINQLAGRPAEPPEPLPVPQSLGHKRADLVGVLVGVAPGRWPRGGRGRGAAAAGGGSCADIIDATHTTKHGPAPAPPPPISFHSHPPTTHPPTHPVPRHPTPPHLKCSQWPLSFQRKELTSTPRDS